MEQKWIKTVDRVPENNGEYLITYVYGEECCGVVSVGTAEYDGAHWTIHGRSAYNAYISETYPILVLKKGETVRGTKISVVAWMPMPEPYKFDVVDLGCAHWDDIGSKVWCSRCGASNKAYKSPYCPHCGAKMEGVEKNESKIEWIPVSEKLPRLEDDVLVTVRNKETGYSAVWGGVRYKNGWAIASCHDYLYLYDADSNLEVIAWAHLLEAYKESKDEPECAHWEDAGCKVWCSRCGASNKMYKSPYCPHCGAKMEGVD